MLFRGQKTLTRKTTKHHESRYDSIWIGYKKSSGGYPVVEGEGIDLPFGVFITIIRYNHRLNTENRTCMEILNSMYVNIHTISISLFYDYITHSRTIL